MVTLSAWTCQIASDFAGLLYLPGDISASWSRTDFFPFPPLIRGNGHGAMELCGNGRGSTMGCPGFCWAGLEQGAVDQRESLMAEGCRRMQWLNICRIKAGG